MVRVVFVCLGNICRSPMAQGVFEACIRQHGLSNVEVDSAGTSNWHIASPPDERAIVAAARRGIDISHLRGRQITRQDLQDFDIIAVMDSQNLAKLRAMATPQQDAKISLLLDFARELDIHEIPDPYYGGPDGFEHVLDLLQAGSRALADHIMAVAS